MAVGNAVGVAHSLLLKTATLRDDADHVNVVSICLFVFLLCACIVLGHLLEENRWMNESITALLLGLCTGVIVLISSKGQSSHVLKFDEELFFIYLLPPIIFNAGFSVKKKQFFENFIAIMLFGVVGVFISFAIISTGTWWLFRKLGLDSLSIRDILAIGVIFSATDSVCTLQGDFRTSLCFSENYVSFTQAGKAIHSSPMSFNVFLWHLCLPQYKTHFDYELILLERNGVGEYVFFFIIFIILELFVSVLQVLNQDETPLLYSLVFGEGVVNDATSVVLFRAVQTYNFDNFTPLEGFQIGGSFLYLFFLSCILGIVSGLISAYIIKTMYFGRHSTDREIAIMIMMAYLSYLLAELFYLSGILSVFFCGIVMSHYTWHNVTVHSRTTTKHTFATMSFIAETFIFLYVGMDALDIDKWRMTQSSFLESLGLFGSLMSLILLGRAAFVFPLSILSNYTTKSAGAKIGVRQMIIIWWAGLMRGAVSIALAFNQFTMDGNKSKTIQDASLITTTITVVLVSTIVFGTLTPPLIAWLYPPHHRSNFSDVSGGLSPKASLDGDYHLLLGDREQDEAAMDPFSRDLSRFQSLRELLTASRSTIHAVWRRFDDAYMRPTFGGRGYVRLMSRRGMESPLEDTLLEDEDQD